jgi:hypothetical protein
MEEVFHSEGDSTFLRNVGKHLTEYGVYHITENNIHQTLQRTRNLTSFYGLVWKSSVRFTTAITQFQVTIATNWPITVAARSKVWTVFARSNAAIAGSNPTRGMDACVRLFCVCVVLCVGSRLATAWSPFQGVLPTVYKIKKLKKRPRSKKRL